MGRSQSELGQVVVTGTGLIVTRGILMMLASSSVIHFDSDTVYVGLDVYIFKTQNPPRSDTIVNKNTRRVSDLRRRKT